MLTWEPSLQLGVSVLDTHHQRLIVLINEVITTSGASAPRAEMQAKLGALLDFTAQHFGLEEDLMIETAYHDRTRHSEQHAELLDQLARFAERISEGSLSARQRAETFGFLGQWLTQHILLTDRPLAAHLLERGWDPVRDNPI